MARPQPPSTTPTHYGRVASIYEPMAWLWSGGRIQRCRRAVAQWIHRGDRVLVAGVGTGSELSALWTADPATIVGVDTSAQMLRRARRREQRTHLVCADVKAWLAGSVSSFDVIYAPFFLNLFAPQRLQQWLVFLRGALPPNGRLLIADFAPPSEGRIQRGIQQLFWCLPMTVCRHLAGGESHPLHDIDTALAASGFQTLDRATFGGLGLPGYAAWCATPAPAAPG